MTPRPMRPRVLAGTGRSGTTWLLDAISDANGLRSVFEPLHPAGLREASQFAYRWAPPEAEWPELERFMARVFAGGFLGLWPDLRVRPDRLARLSEPRALYGTWRRVAQGGWRYWRERERPPLVKLIRANLMLGWLRRRFDARVVLLVRHPGGVVASTMELGGADWHHAPRLASYRREPALAGWFERLDPVLGRDPTPVAAHTALWCIENAIPLERAREWGIVCVHYEPLLQGDDGEWKRLLDALDLASRPHRELVARPSQQASREMRRTAFDASQVDRWMRRLGPAERADLDRVLRAFGTSVYSAEDGMPAVAIAPATGGASSS